MESDSNDLAVKAATGDRAAFARLVEAEYGFIYKVAWKWTRNREESEDVAQEVCVRLGQSISKFRGHGRFQTWLYTLVLNTVRDNARKIGRERRRVESWVSDPTTGPAAAAEDDNAGLWQAVAMLPDKQRDAILLVYGEGLPHSRAADVMGVAEATVSWHVHEARKRLKVLMATETVDG